MAQAPIRKALRNQRKALSAAHQLNATKNLNTRLCQLAEFRLARRLAFYLATDGEIDPSLSLAIALAAGKNCFLPVLHPLKFNRLYFSRHNESSTLSKNRFGIDEPALSANTIAPAWTLDIIFMPLVGFDRSCNRIGMGAGFYDRTLAFKRHSKSCKPLLIGLAHQLQEVDTTHSNPWDIPLNMVITDQHIFRRTRH